LNAWWFVAAGAGLALLAAAIAAAGGPTIRPWERHTFHALNGLPDWLYLPLWLPMQLGNLVVGTAVGVVVGLVVWNWAVVIGAVVAMWLKLVSEKVIRTRMAGHLDVRQRPGTSQEGAVLRGDVPATGASFPSGHVILVAAVACVVMPVLPLWSWWIPIVLALLVVAGRVYVGAHNPLDVIAGLGAGVLAGGAIAAFIG
jgi:undecaprenyl-diphosphatase